MALGEVLTKLPASAVASLAGRCVSVLVAVVWGDQEWKVVDAACAALASAVIQYPETVMLTDDVIAHEDTSNCLPHAASIARKMFELLPLNIGHASSVLVALMRVSAPGISLAVEDYVRNNIQAYTEQDFSVALSGMYGLQLPFVNLH
jgi:hypothetical protein